LNVLYDKVQGNPEYSLYNELLIWVKLQKNDFRGALIQSKALDRKEATLGDHTLEIGQIAFDNMEYTTAIKAFEFVVDNFPNTFNYEKARRLLINSKESKIKNTFPVDLEAIRNLVSEYETLVQEIGLTRNTLEALRDKALLHAYYLDQEQEAIDILNQIISHHSAGSLLVAKAKLDLGDIFLLIEEPWESSLLYSQVEKTNKETPIGYEAKLRNAKLHYYNGDFSLAQSHLDILKDATTREIANDALNLSLLIKNNTILDSTDLIMKEYSSVELLLFRNKQSRALKKLDSLISEFPDHSLVDEIHMMKYEIYLEKGEFSKAKKELQQIVENFSEDILADDAYFKMGVLEQDHLKNPEGAQEIYRDFLTRFPGSIYVAEARKRFRTIRGDVI
jgi:outer membrane protein assembly factor BamD (BamD/ComL family)